MNEIDGKVVARWILNTATEQELQLLVGVEFSDADNVYIIKQAKTGGIVAAIEGTSSQARLSLHMLESGSFFIDDTANHLASLIYQSRSPVDQMIDEAKSLLSSKGFTVSEMGGDTRVLKIAQIDQVFSQQNLYPSPDEWHSAHEIFKTSGLRNMSLGAQMMQKWLDVLERGLGGRFDAYYRNLLAALYRNSGNTSDALRVSDVVNAHPSLYESNGVAEGMLRVTRAATLMDGIEKNFFSDNFEALRKVKGNLDKAHAIFRGNSEEVRSCYYRMDSLKSKIMPNGEL